MTPLQPLPNDKSPNGKSGRGRAYVDPPLQMRERAGASTALITTVNAQRDGELAVTQPSWSMGATRLFNETRRFPTQISLAGIEGLNVLPAPSRS